MKESYKLIENTPTVLGFRMPAEWEPHEATWISWPHNHTDWLEKFSSIPSAYAQLVSKIAPGEMVRILVNSDMIRAQAQQSLRDIGVDMAAIEFFEIPTNRSWTRDFGPIFVQRYDRSDQVAIVRFRFNGWARYPDWEKDDAIPEQVAHRLDFPLFNARINTKDIVLEGGSIDVNGRGTLLTTEECLLDREVQVRNPDLNKEEVEIALHDYLGVSNILWLGRGIVGDDTHGHIDDFCRFVRPDTVVLCQERDPKDINYAPLEENRERLEGMRLEDGSRIEIARLPMPAPLYLNESRLPATYANFYISNAAVLVPTFNDANDRIALGILSELFTDRPVIGIHAGEMVWGFGTLHCATQQQPIKR